MPSSRALRLVDVALAVWVATWIGIGVAIGVSVGELTGISDTMVTVGHAVQTTGRSLVPLESVPLVGGGLAEDSRQIQSAGASAVRNGAASVSTIQTLAVLLAIVVALVPSIPVLAVYVPLRVRRARQLRALLSAGDGRSRSGSKG